MTKAYDPSGQELWTRTFDFTTFAPYAVIGSPPSMILGEVSSNDDAFQVLSLTGATSGIVDVGNSNVNPLVADSQPYFTGADGVLAAHATP